jgi:hypothetical protein
MGLMSRAVSPWIAALVCFSSSAFAVNGDAHRERYRLQTASQKLVDNRGNGYQNLYGVRNFRAVLNGVLYRGGANNAYHKDSPRNNQNPLPDDGLMNLCQEGFSTAVYLYSTRYNTAPHSVNCRMADGSTNHLTYKQISILSVSNSQLHDVLELILGHVRGNNGPIYAHCWNGWHASGITGAYALRQFCGFSGEEAVSYWNENTDGNNGSSYNGIRNRIRDFVPFADLELTSAERSQLCPRPGDLSF